jgi:SAM-dependent MidA family methyltransferase
MTFHGQVRFDEFMARALHDPGEGYYARNISSIGRRGDFTTAPMLSGTTARAIAQWAAQALRESNCRDLIEIGPGQGALALAVLKQLPWSLRWRVRLHLVETSAPLRQHQSELLGRRARWHATPADALAACGGHAVIFSNELVDAFPVRRFQRTPDGWRELALSFDSSRHAREVLLPPGPLPPSASFALDHPMGQWLEVHDSYRQWLADWLPKWRAGRLLTIDYGSTAEFLYHRRPRGTIRAYFHHQLLEGGDVYANPGRQDLTADVNFTDLIVWSSDWTSGARLQPFREFIAATADPSNPSDQALLAEHGAGDAFLVLDQTCKLNCTV